MSAFELLPIVVLGPGVLLALILAGAVLRETLLHRPRPVRDREPVDERRVAATLHPRSGQVVELPAREPAVVLEFRRRRQPEDGAA